MYLPVINARTEPLAKVSQSHRHHGSVAQATLTKFGGGDDIVGRGPPFAADCAR